MSERAIKWAHERKRQYKPAIRRLLLEIAQRHEEGRPLYLFTPDFHGITLSMPAIRRWAASEPVELRRLDGPCLESFVLNDSCGFRGGAIRSALLLLRADDVIDWAMRDHLGQDQLGVLGELWELRLPLDAAVEPKGR